MTIKKILIITNSHDLHADLIIPILIEKNHQPFRINLDRFPRDYQVTQAFKQGKLTGKIVHLPSAEQLSLTDIGAVWMRKPADFCYLSDDLAPQELAFAKQETEHALFGFIYAADSFWMSHPVAMRGAMWKAEQLKRALQVGFTIPDSLVTNVPEEVHDFKRAIKGELIYKTMSSPTLAAEEVAESEVQADGIPTTIVTDEMLQSLDSVAALPCHFQAYIEKQYELRVTIIGEQIFAARINSQEDSRTKIDSRDIAAEISYQAVELPESIKEKCFAFVNSYDLNYSALDIIVTPENDYVFLENNPNGQFLYVEQLIPEYKMLETLADTLIKEVLCRSQ